MRNPAYGRGGVWPAPLAPPLEHYDDLGAEEVIGRLASLERDDLIALPAYVQSSQGRRQVLSAIEAVLTTAPAGASS